jgi:hypothetical protein
MAEKYSVAEIDGFIAKVHAEAGDHAFMTMRLMELEAFLRKHDKSHTLPGKTLLRERINAYRSARWPATAPKKIAPRHRW